MATDRKAEVTWNGDLTSGGGRVDSVTSGAFGGLDVSWPARSEEPLELEPAREPAPASPLPLFPWAATHHSGKRSGYPPDRPSCLIAVFQGPS